MNVAISLGLDWLQSSNVVERSGWVLVHSVWQFAVVALLAFLLNRTLRRASASARYTMLVAALLLVVAAPVATWYCVEIDSLTDIASSAPVTLNQPDDNSEEPAVSDDAIPVARSETLSTEWQQDETDSQSQPLPDPAAATAAAATVENHLPWTVRFADAVHPWLPVIVGLWCVGVLLFSIRPVWGWCVVRRLRTVGVTPVPDVVQQTLDRMCGRLKVGRRVHALQSTLVTSPVVVGCFRSVILLPASFIAGVPLPQLEAILAHELAHVRRYDYAANLLQTLVETLFFYHPAVWWLSHRIRIERENCCDDLVVAALGNKIEYGRALLAVEQFRSTATGSLALGANDGSLLSRVRRMVGDRSLEKQPDRFGQSGLIVLLSGAVLAAATWAFVLAAEPERETSPPSPLVATLPNGAKVELLAVGYHQWRRNEWWNPNGTSLAAEPDAAGLRRVTLSKATASGRQQDCREFAVRITGLPEGTHHFGYHYVFDDFTDLVHRAVMYQPGEFRMGTFARNANDPDATISLRVGMDENPDLLVRSIDATGRKMGDEPQTDLARKVDALMQPLGTVEIDGRAGLILKHMSREALREGPLIRESAPEAIDVSGQRYQAIDYENRPDGFVHIYALPLNQVQRFEYRFGVFETWATFENVSLQPGRKTEPKVTVESSQVDVAAGGIGENSDQVAIAESDEWPPRDAASLLKQWKARDAAFLNRSIQVEQRWVAHVDPHAVLDAEQRRSVVPVGSPPTRPREDEIPEPYDQPHRVRFLMTTSSRGVTFDNGADLETILHPRYEAAVQARRWPGLGPEVFERTMLESRIWWEQERNLKRSSIEWTCGFGVAKRIPEIDSMRIEGDRLVIQGNFRSGLHFWSTREERDRIGSPKDHFEVELDRDLIVRRAVLEIATEPARHTRSPLLEAFFNKRDAKDIDRYRRFVVETSGTARYGDAPPIATHGRYQVFVENSQGETIALPAEEFSLVAITGTLSDDELRRRTSDDRQPADIGGFLNVERDAVPGVSQNEDISENSNGESPPLEHKVSLEEWQARIAEKLPGWMQPLYGNGLLARINDQDEVISVTTSRSMTDDLMAKLATLPQLRELHIEVTTDLTPAGLQYLAKMPRLEKLSLYQVNADGQGMGDAAIRGLLGSTSIRELSIGECGTTDAGVKLLEQLPQLTSLSLRQEGRLTDASLASIGRLSHLKSLSLNSYVGVKGLGWMRFSAAGIRGLRGLKDLEELHLVGHNVHYDSLDFPRMTSLSLGHADIGDGVGSQIGQLRSLRNLELTYCRLGDRSLKGIASLPELRQFNISSSTVTDAGIEHFRSNKTLEHITLRVDGLTDRSLEHLAQIKTLSRVDLYGTGQSGFLLPGRNFSIGGLLQLKTLPELHTLWLTNFDSGGGGYIRLKELAHLRELTMMMCNVRNDELEALEEALPNTRISHMTGGWAWVSSRDRERAEAALPAVSGTESDSGPADEEVQTATVRVEVPTVPFVTYGDQLLVSWIHDGDHRNPERTVRVVVLKDGTVIVAGDGVRNRECRIKLAQEQLETLMTELDEQDGCFNLTADSLHFIQWGENYNGWDRTADWFLIRRGSQEVHVGCIYGWESGTENRIPGAVIVSRIMNRLYRLISLTRAGGWDEVERLLPAANAALEGAFPQLAPLTRADFSSSERYLYPARSVSFRKGGFGNNSYGVELERRDDGTVNPITVWYQEDRRDVENIPVVRGLNLANVPCSSEWKDIEVLRVRTQNGYEYKPEYRTYELEEETWVCHVPTENQFYIEVGNNQRRRRLYGPIAGDPLKVLSPPPIAVDSDNAVATPAPAKGLEFLQPYPKLHRVSLKMTESQFLEIVELQKLKASRTVDGGSTTYAIGLGDGHTLLVMFGNNGEMCSGIQRIQGEDEEQAESDDPGADEQVAAPALEFRIVAQPADSQVEPRVPADFANRDYPGNSAIARSIARDKGFVWVSVTDWPDQDIATQPVERRLDGNVRQILLADTPAHAMPFGSKWSVEECRAAPEPNGDQFQIRIKLNDAGAAAIRKLTGSHLNQSLAVVIDNQIIAAPIIRSSIGGDIAISGNFTREQAERLATAIRGEPSAETSALESPTPEQPDKAAAPSVIGRVLIDGPIPIVPPLKVKKNLVVAIPRNDEERQRNAEIARNAVEVEMPDDSLVVGSDGGVANVVIYLRQAPGNWKPTPPPAEPVEISCGDHRFEPHVSFVRVGQPIRVLGPKQSADSFFVQTFRSSPINVLVPAGMTHDSPSPFQKPEPLPVQVTSNIHPWMQAWMLSLDHPFAAITDADGRFEIRGLPPGEHHFRVWHERRGYLDKDLVVRVEAGKVATADLKFPAEMFAPRDAEPAGDQPAPQGDAEKAASDEGRTSWNVRRPDGAKSTTTETAQVLDDDSVQMSLPSPGSSEVTVTFPFQTATSIEAVRVELLPDTRFKDRRLGRNPARELRLFEVKPSVVSADGKARSFDWDECSFPQNPDDSDVANLIDHATDTGWKVSPLTVGQTSHELIFRLKQPLVLQPGDSLQLSLDTGGSSELDTLARFRVSFPATVASVDEGSADRR